MMFAPAGNAHTDLISRTRVLLAESRESIKNLHMAQDSFRQTVRSAREKLAEASRIVKLAHEIPTFRDIIEDSESISAKSASH